MIDKPIIEALASLGTGIAPSFQWSADALSLNDALEGLSVNRLCLPAHCENNDAVIAMAMAMHATETCSTRMDLPQKQFRRIATLGMHFGAMLAEVAQTLDIHERKVVALLEVIQAELDVTSTKPSLQALLVAATCAAKLRSGNCQSVVDACQKILIFSGVNLKVLEIVGNVMDEVMAASATKDYAEIASKLFPDVGPEYEEPPEDEKSTEEMSKSQSAGDPSEPGEQGDDAGAASGESSDSKSGDCDTAVGSSESGENKTEEDQPGNATDTTKDDASEDSSMPETQGQGQSMQAEAGKSGSDDAKPDEGTHADADVESEDSQSETLVAEPQPLTKVEDDGDAVSLLDYDLEGVSGGQGKVADLGLNKLHFAKNQNLVTEIVRLLQSQDKRFTQLRDCGRRIAATKVWRLKRLGDTKIFKHTQKVVGSQVAVEILIDGSGSMKTDLKLACEVALSFGEALQRLTKATSAISIFSGGYGVSQVLKEHGEPVQKGTSKLSTVFASGGTPTGHAMMQRMKLLEAQKQERKLMIVITDGAASNPAIAVAATHLLEERGIEVIGVGLGREGVKIQQYIPNSVCVNELGQLQFALKKVMQTREMS